MNELDKRLLSGTGWTPKERHELFEELVPSGWNIENVYDREAVVALRGNEFLHLGLLEESISVTYKRNAGTNAKGGAILRSGRPVSLLVVSLNELINSF